MLQRNFLILNDLLQIILNHIILQLINTLLNNKYIFIVKSTYLDPKNFQSMKTTDIYILFILHIYYIYITYTYIFTYIHINYLYNFYIYKYYLFYMYIVFFLHEKKHNVMARATNLFS